MSCSLGDGTIMKQKINLGLAGIALIAVLVTAIGVMAVYYNLFQNQVREYLCAEAKLLSQSRQFHMPRPLPETVKAAKSGASPVKASLPFPDQEAFFKALRTENLRITWVAADGQVLGDNHADINQMDNHLNRPEVLAALHNGFGESVRNSFTLGTDTFNYALRLEDSTVLRVSTEARTITSVFFEALPMILLIITVVLAICLIISRLLTYQLIHPIEAMAEHLDDNILPPIYRELIPFSNKIRSQHERILAAAKSRQDFTANVSHELKTPLTAISGYAELIENRMVDVEQDAYMAKQIHHNAQRLLSLINKIIQLSELDHPEQPPQFVPFDIHKLVLECCESLQINALQKKISLSCTGSSTVFSAAPELIRELVINLVQNAIFYTNYGGWVKVSVEVRDRHPVLVVQDNGIGIPKDQQDCVFERFYRVDKSRSRETGGTGLGLSLVKHIAEIHDARITLESEPGQGTTVTVLF